ncbi:MAG: T9SS type A sorting domain-containing protein, partial [Paludibacteraceae bacterium]|nr:T9SS type A sorting domain-containing protein [Paludibacteraceae bacterium]
VATTTKIDTLNALEVQKVEGQIVDEDSVLVSDFNGTVDITVYDKIQKIPTRDNDKEQGEAEVVDYLDYPNTLFSGKTEVKDGLFNYTFMVPKDIRYNYGNGRIVYYARTFDEVGTEEAIGHFEQFIIGGTGSIVTADNEGPEMMIYLNNPAFQDGDKTYPTPRFYANLYDENGINTAGAGIGHDLMLIIDDDAKQTYSINEYFTSADDSYQRGQVSYLMTELPDGPHTLTFRAWDLLNNSTTKSLSFVVEAGLDPSIYSITTYPNPVRATGTLKMMVNYDQPDELLTTEIYLLNTNGQMIWKRTQENPDNIELNMAEIGLRPGIYFYSIRIKSENSKFTKSSGKIIVTK